MCLHALHAVDVLRTQICSQIAHRHDETGLGIRYKQHVDLFMLIRYSAQRRRECVNIDAHFLARRCVRTPCLFVCPSVCLAAVWAHMIR